MTKKERQKKLSDLIKVKRIENQHVLLAELEKLGITTNQATISRDLTELGIAKVKGVYALPQIRSGESALTDFLEIEAAGEHLLVVRTLPGKANAVAISLDDARIAEIVGTLAGDDTIFVATRSLGEQKIATKKIIQHFRRS